MESRSFSRNKVTSGYIQISTDRTAVETDASQSVKIAPLLVRLPSQNNRPFDLNVVDKQRARRSGRKPPSNAYDSSSNGSGHDPDLAQGAESTIEVQATANFCRQKIQSFVDF
ncbi:hypothetical protein QMN58_25370 [Escherichia coli]|nr:hypothetical protein [Escherichia coli]